METNTANIENLVRIIVDKIWDPVNCIMSAEKEVVDLKSHKICHYLI